MCLVLFPNFRVSLVFCYVFLYKSCWSRFYLSGCCYPSKRPSLRVYDLIKHLCFVGEPRYVASDTSQVFCTMYTGIEDGSLVMYLLKLMLTLNMNSTHPSAFNDPQHQVSGMN